MAKFSRERLQDPRTAKSLTTPPQFDSRNCQSTAASTIDELREAVRVRDEFIAFAAHELRNPLTPIQLCVRLIRDAEQNGDRAKLIAEVSRLERLLDLFLRRTRVLLDVTQLVSGKVRLETVETCLSDLVEAVVSDLEPLLSRSGSSLKLNLARGLAARTDPLAFTQIFENLLSNAIKYGMGRQIVVSLEPLEGSTRLTVRDHGPGIAQADQARIFEPFERAIKRSSQPGFGLGLWITRRLVEGMGGKITVSSEQGAGSVFTVMLPLNPPLQTDEQ
jgi:two-component system OmpR family sensor kinase